MAGVGQKPKIGLIFCEDENDAESLKNIAKAVRPTLPRIDYCRKPLILVRDMKKAEDRKKNAANVLAAVRAREVLSTVQFVIAHQDCDDFEPAHVQLAIRIKAELEAQGIQSVVAATPAWEIEAWWFLWPAAVASVNSKWNALKRKGNHGMIKDAKETLRKDLHVKGVRQYEESDSRKISQNVLSQGLVNTKQGTSSSFEAFRTEILNVTI
jgi:hypothetical protein